MSLTSIDADKTIYGAPVPMIKTHRPTPATAPIQRNETEYAPHPHAEEPAPTQGDETVLVPHAEVPAPTQGDETVLVPHAEVPAPTQGDETVLVPHAEEPAPVAPPAPPAPHDTVYPLPPGSTIGKHKEYTIEEHLGQGGFGHTYLVSNGKVKHVVKECAPRGFSQRDTNGAIHPIPGREDDFYKLRDYFNNEIDILNATNGKDSSIVHLVDEFDNHHTKYYVMAHLPGGSLHDLRREKKRAFNEDELKKVLNDLLGALDALHAANIIHRDIKSQNIMRTASGDSVLIDFGTACFTWKTAKALRAASLNSAPPEAVAADYTDKIGPHTDLYELGATIYYLITGEDFHQPDLINKLNNIFSAHQMTTDEVQKLVAPYLLCRREEIMEMKAYSPGFRKALCKALEPDISKRLTSAKEWQELISEEKLKAERTSEELRKIDAIINDHPENIDEDMIDKLHQLKAFEPGAALSLAKCYKYLWRKAEKEQMPVDAKKNLELYEKYLKESREHKIEGAFREAANHLLRQKCGTMDEASLEQAAAWYEQQAQNCRTALGVMRTYKRLARTLGFTGAHNRYLQEKHLAKECALLPNAGAQNIHARLRGIAQLLCLLLSCGLCLPLIWFMALMEYKQISQHISPIHLTELND